MKRIYKKLAWGLVAALAVASTACEDFDQMNKNPGGITADKVQPMYLLSPYLVQSTLNADLWQRIENLGTEHFSQYFINEPKYENQTCQCNDSWSVWYWNQAYTWITNLNKVIEICDPETTINRNNIQQAARVWKVWVYTRLTDYFGDVPYFEVNKTYGAAPKYDKQEDIYRDMLKELAEASAAFNDRGYDELGGSADPIFNGDISRWIQLANTLRLRLAMRVSYADPTLAKQEAAAAVAAPGGFITEDVTVWKQRDYYQNIGANLFYTFPHYWGKSLAMSRSMERVLTNLGGIAVTKPANRTEPKKPYTEWTVTPEAVTWYKDSIPAVVDPRGLIMFDVTSAGTLASYSRTRETVNGKKVWKYTADYRGRWSGIEAGMPVTEANEPNNNCVNNSRLGSFFITPQRPDNYLASSDAPTDAELVVAEARDQILVYANEVDFLLAEACIRGYISGDAKTHYENGIRKSMKFYNRDKTLITDATIDAYLASTMKNQMGTSVAFNDSEGSDTDETNYNSKLHKIITQKYIAGFPEAGFEAWADYRRTGIPALDPMRGAVTGSVKEWNADDWKGSLRRIQYPMDEHNLNPNIDEALQRMGGTDAVSARMWWDARTTIVKVPKTPYENK